MKRILYAAPKATKALFFLFFLAFNACLSAQTQTASLSVQGVLTRSDGTAVDDGNDYVLTFRLWTAETGGTKVHEETINNISIVGGVYSVVLGVTPGNPPLTAAFNQTYWLGVSVNTSTIELLPRPRLTHAPYALGLVGQNNVFPSTGTVIADAINVAGNANATAFKAGGGLPVGPNASNGYSLGAGGDADGGLFSDGDNNVGLYANATKALEANGAGVSIPGTLTNGPQTVNGWQEVNGLQTINSNQIVNGFSTVTANQTVDGIVRSGGGVVNKAFTNTGMFLNSVNRDIQFNVNGVNRLLLGDNGVNYLTGTQFSGAGVYIFDNGGAWNNSPFKIQTLREGPNGRNVQWDPASGSIYWDNSSRKSKRDIRKFEEDFTKILSTEAKIYRRHGSPDSYWEIGYIAEEIDSLGLTKLATRGLDGVVDGVNYDRIGLYAIEMIKIQHAEIEAMKAEIATLKAANLAFQNANTSLQTNNTDLQRQQNAFSAQLESISKRMLLLEGKAPSNSKK